MFAVTKPTSRTIVIPPYGTYVALTNELGNPLEPLYMTSSAPLLMAVVTIQPENFLTLVGPPAQLTALPPGLAAARTSNLGSSSTTRAWRPFFSHAISVVPEPANGSSTVYRLLLLFLMARSTSSTGFCVGCRTLARGLFTNQMSP
jgi:hypothetical protein